jgi:predicted kinase
MKNKIIVLKGLPASGKSTWAKEFLDRNMFADKQTGWLRINKDDLRAMMHNSKWSKGNEKQILLVRDAAIRAALAGGYNVIVDDTNFAPQHVETITNIAKEFKAEVEVKFFDVSLADCLLRNQNRPNRVADQVIKDMYYKYVLPAIPKPTNNPAHPKAIVCDLDGTLAIHVNRGPFEFAKCYSDDINQSVLKVLKILQYDGYKIIFVSGREDSCKDQTIAWLMNRCWLDMERECLLYMRKTGDNRKDYIIKQEIYENEILTKYYVEFVLDDRQQVVDNLRDMGLQVWQVARGDF